MKQSFFRHISFANRNLSTEPAYTERAKKGERMTTTEIITLKKIRLANMRANGRNIKSPGVIRKVTREIRNLEKIEMAK